MADDSTSLSNLEVMFNIAANHLPSIAPTLDSGQLLKLYGLYKQATVGICNTPKPSWYQTQAKYKWEAWKSLGDMSKTDAMEIYISVIDKLSPNEEREASERTRSWVAVSSLLNTDSELTDADKTLLDWIKEGNEKKVWDMLSIDASAANSQDEEGMMPIHWAADRGHLGILKYLVENGADVNAQDHDGQTSLHYATSCGHRAVVEYLLSVGAKFLEDNKGVTPKDIADENIIAIL